jgi:hypothetical protein
MFRTRTRIAAIAIVAAAALAGAGGNVHAAGGTGGGGTATGGGGGGGTATGGVDAGTGGVGGGKAVCVPNATLTASAGLVPGAMGITAGYALASCVNKPHVRITMTNTSTNLVEYASPVDFLGSSVFYSMPYFGTTYRVDLSVTSGTNPAVIATSTALVTTMATPPNCATITNSNESVGYWGTYAAVWVSTTAKDCGYGRQTVHLKITNLSTGRVEYDNPYVGMVSTIDFEGPIVSYDTPYQVDIEVRGAGNEILDSRSDLMVTPPAK